MVDYSYPPRRYPDRRYDEYSDNDYRRPRRRSPEPRKLPRRYIDDYDQEKSYKPREPPRYRRRDYSPEPQYRRRRDSPRPLQRCRKQDYDSPHNQRRSHDHYNPPRRRNHRAVSDTKPNLKLQHAAKAAIDAAAVEAVRVRKEPGAWVGPKGMRVATAALGAAATDGAAQKLRNKDVEEDSSRQLIQSTMGGLMVNRLLHGSRQHLTRHNGRRRK